MANTVPEVFNRAMSGMTVRFRVAGVEGEFERKITSVAVDRSCLQFEDGTSLEAARTDVIVIL